MERTEQKAMVKYMRQAMKSVKMARTMFEKIKGEIGEDNANSEISKMVDNYIEPLDRIINTFDITVIEGFKTEQKMPGCQLAMNFD